MQARQYTQEDIQKCLKYLKDFDNNWFVNLRAHLVMLQKQLYKNPPVWYSNLPLQMCFIYKKKLSFEWIASIIEILGVTTVNLSNNGFKLTDVNRFIEPHLLQLKVLDLRGNALGDDYDMVDEEAWEKFLLLLKSSQITKLNIQGNELSNVRMMELKKIIKENCRRCGTEFIWDFSAPLFNSQECSQRFAYPRDSFLCNSFFSGIFSETEKKSKSDESIPITASPPLSDSEEGEVSEMDGTAYRSNSPGTK